MELIDFNIVARNTMRLFELAHANDTDEFISFIQSLDKSEVDVNLQNEKGQYIIFIAIRFNNLKIVRELMNYDLRLNVKTAKRKTVFHTPIRREFHDMLKLLLDYHQSTLGFDMINDGSDRPPVLFYAVEQNNLTAFDLLIKYGAQPDIYHEKSDMTVLMRALILKRMNMLKLKQLISWCPKTINKHVDKMQLTPLIYACMKYPDFVIEHMLNYGANINIPYYTLSGHEGGYPQHFAMNRDNVQIMEIMTKFNMNVNLQNYYGQTILIMAFIKNNIALIDYLLKTYEISRKSVNINIMNVNISDRKGYTPAYQCILVESLRHYLEHILKLTNLNQKTTEQTTILILIVKNGLWNEYKSYLDLRNVNLFIRDIEGKTVLDHADQKQRNELIDMTSLAYYEHLAKHAKQWIESWQNECSLHISKQKEYCLSQIRKQIVKDKISFPIKKFTPTIMFVEGEIVTISSFSAESYDEMASIYYLRHKYKNLWIYSDEDLNLKSPKQSVAIVCIKQKLIIPKQFKHKICEAIESGNYDVLNIYVTIAEPEGLHANMLLFYVHSFTLELFNPATSYYYLAEESIKLFNYILSKYRRKILFNNQMNVKTVGFFQNFQAESNYERRIGDVGGWCLAWCIWYVDHRMMNLHVPYEKFYKHLYRQTITRFDSTTNMIRNYTSIVTNILNDTMLKFDLTYNDLVMVKYPRIHINRFNKIKANLLALAHYLLHE